MRRCFLFCLGERGVDAEQLDGLYGEYEGFKRQLERTVIYKAATPSFMVSGDNRFVIDPLRFSGLSTYIPLQVWKNSNAYLYFFEKLEWSGVYSQE